MPSSLAELQVSYRSPAEADHVSVRPLEIRSFGPGAPKTSLIDQAQLALGKLHDTQGISEVHIRFPHPIDGDTRFSMDISDRTFDKAMVEVTSYSPNTGKSRNHPIHFNDEGHARDTDHFTLTIVTAGLTRLARVLGHVMG